MDNNYTDEQDEQLTKTRIFLNSFCLNGFTFTSSFLTEYDKTTVVFIPYNYDDLNFSELDTRVERYQLDRLTNPESLAREVATAYSSGEISSHIIDKEKITETVSSFIIDKEKLKNSEIHCNVNTHNELTNMDIIINSRNNLHDIDLADII